MMDDKEQKTLQIWTDPESKIRFLETIMHGKDWKADIHIAKLDAPGARHIAELTQKLKTKGYEIEQITHDDGHRILRVKHEHDPQDLGRLFRDYGIVTGAAHVISRPLVAAKDLIVDSANTLSHAAHALRDPARANGFMFLLAEVCIIMGGKEAKYGSFWNPKNYLLSTAAAFWGFQSAEYLFLAEKGDERILRDIDKRFAKSDKKSGKMPDFAALSPVDDRKSAPFYMKPWHWILDHPIEAGAISNNLGMFAFVGHAVLEKRFKLGLIKEIETTGKAITQVKGVEIALGADKLTDLKKSIDGFWWAIGGAATSLVAWTLLLLPKAEYKEKSSNPLVHVWQTIRENPEKAAGIIAAASSSQRMVSGIKNENKWHTAGEAIYVPGDLMLLFTKSHEYGSSTGGDHSALLDAIAEHMQKMPVLMSPAARDELATNIAAYIGKCLAITNTASQEKQDSSALANQLAGELMQKMAAKGDTKFDALMGAAQRLVTACGDGMQSQVASALIEVMPKLQGVSLDHETLRRQLSGTPVDSSRGPKSNGLDIQHISKEIADLVFTVPGPYAAENASLIYDALSPLLQPHCEPKKHLDSVMTVQAQAAIAAAGGLQRASRTEVMSSDMAKPVMSDPNQKPVKEGPDSRVIAQTAQHSVHSVSQLNQRR